jgi:putative photosynthetic complex assembly protein 2
MELSRLALPVLFTLFLWWFSTGAILYLDGLPRHTFRWSLLGASVLLVAALGALALTAGDTGTVAHYIAFSAALAVWGWVEIMFLTGTITGPRTIACPPDVHGWRRARLAVGTVLYHELALLAGLAAIAVVTFDAPNQLGLWTFAVLWVARQSTKLNLFLGVRNLSEEFLPEHLRYLESYFRRRRMNLLFPISLIAALIAAGALWQAALAGLGDVAAMSLLATLVSLAVLEHLFLVLPINVAALWEWGFGSRRVERPATGA